MITASELIENVIEGVQPSSKTMKLMKKHSGRIKGRHKDKTSFIFADELDAENFANEDSINQITTEPTKTPNGWVVNVEHGD